MPGEIVLPDRHPDVIRPEEEERILQGIRKAISIYNAASSQNYACTGCGLVHAAEAKSFYKTREGAWVMESPAVDTTGWAHVTINPTEGYARIERYCPPCVEKRDAAVGPDPQKKEGDSA